MLHPAGVDLHCEYPACDRRAMDPIFEDALTGRCPDHQLLEWLGEAGGGARSPASTCAVESCTAPTGTDAPAPVPPPLRSFVSEMTRLGSQYDRRDRHCLLHAFRLAVYGREELPAFLATAPTCQYEERTSGTSQVCPEPAFANLLCLRHVAGEEGLDRAQTVLERLASAEADDLVEEPEDEAMRVLAKIHRMSEAGVRGGRATWPSRETVRAHVPNIDDAVFTHRARPTRTQRLTLAHAYSPYSLGRALDMDPRDVDTHLQSLRGMHWVRESRRWHLHPSNVIVVAPDATETAGEGARRPVRRRASWLRRAPRRSGSTRTAATDRDHAERDVELVFDGPGVVDIDHQGRALVLRGRGVVRLRAWEMRTASARADARSERVVRRLTVVTAFVAVASIVSIIADMGGATNNIEQFLTWLRRSIG